MEKSTKQEKKEKGGKPNYHPYPSAKISCSCGNVMKVGSTEKEMHVEICSACHPFYTGSQKFVDTGGRIEKFKKRLARKEEMATKKKSSPAKISKNKKK